MTKTDWLAKFNFEEYYVHKAGLPGLIKDDHLQTRCPFHNDNNPSLSISLKSPGFYKCFACSASGNVVQFHARLHGLRMQEAEEELRIIGEDRKVVPIDEVNQRHKQLLETQAVLDFLHEKRGYSDETISKFRLGFDGDRVWIPVFFRGHCVNVRKYDWLHNGANAKFLNYAKDYGDARLFPHENLDQDRLFIFEGETDCMLANQMGIRGITGTGGAGTWKDWFNEYVEGKDVIICYDADRAGQEGALDVALRILPLAKTVKKILLPLKAVSKDEKDFTDWVTKGGNSADDFNALVDATPVFQTARAEERKDDGKIHKVSLSRSSAAEFYFKRVEVSVTTAGKNLTPWHAPVKMTLSCPVNQGARCKKCALKNGLLAMSVPLESQDLLKLIDCTDIEQKRTVARIAGVAECPVWKFRADETVNVEEVRAIPEVTFSDEHNQYVARGIYSVTNESVKTNRSYVMEGISMPHPESQYATILVYKASQAQASCDKFKMISPIRDRLAGVLCPEVKDEAPLMEKVKAVDQHMNAIATDIAANVTRIRKRDDIVLATLLAYASVRRFRFDGETVKKGWVEVLIMGDTRTGKSKTVEGLVNYLRLGEFVTGENSTYAGLVGGMSQVGDRWNLTWGKIPLNNGGLLVIDEASGLEEQDLSRMSGIRSSGVAEITKIQTEKTEAMTRLVWISNPRNKKSLNMFTYGVHAVRELFGAPEDIARIDLAVTAASGEVSPDEINTLNHDKIEHRFTDDIIRDAVLWAWSRKEDEIDFAPGSPEAVMQAARALGETYTSDVPLVEPSEIRIKVAKLAVAAAVLCFSTADGEKIVVEPEHVMWAAIFIDRCYSKPSMGYRMFSEGARRYRETTQSMRDEIKKEFKLLVRWPKLLESFLSVESFRKKDLLDTVGYGTEEGRDLWVWLHSRGLILNKPWGFIKTPAFTDVLREMAAEAREIQDGKPEGGLPGIPAPGSEF